MWTLFGKATDRIGFYFRQWRLAHQLLFFALIVTVALTALAGTLIVRLEAQSFYRQSLLSFEHAFNLIRASTFVALGRADAAALTYLVEQAGQSHPNVLRIEVQDPSGRLSADWTRDGADVPPLGAWMEASLTLDGQSQAVLRVLWDSAPQELAQRQQSNRLLAVLGSSLLLLTTLLVALTRIFVVGPIRGIHDSLYADRPQQLGPTPIALELRHLADAARVQVLLKLEIKRSERRYRGLFDNMAAGCMVLSFEDNDFRIEDINSACRRMPAINLGGRHVERLSEVIDIREVPELYDALYGPPAAQINRAIGEFSVIRDERAFWFECHVFAIEDGEIVLFIDDITERKQSFLLRQAKEAAEHANELKSNFMASISHEIRTPLNGVLSMIELLYGSHLSNKQRHWVEAVRSSGQLLLGTINDILDFSKIEAGHVHLDRIQFSLSEVLSNLLNATAQRAYAKGLELVLNQDHSLPDQLIGDPFRLQQILVNLVGNAIKFTERGSVVIALEKREIPGDALLLRVSVSDTGVGIAPKHLKQVFLPFEQAAKSRNMFAEGTGLGLAICKRLVDAMDGTIAVESVLGEGSHFHFEIPVGLAPGVARARWLMPQRWSRCTALIRLRHAQVCDAIARTLRSFGFATVQAASVGEMTTRVEQASERAASYLLVLDDHLLRSEGTRLVAELGNVAPDAEFLVLYVVNMFSHGREELEELNAQQNTSYVTKPVQASALYNTLQGLFGMRSRLEKPPIKLDALPWEVLVQRMHAHERLAGAQLLLVEDNLVNQEVTVEALAMAGIDVQIAPNGEEAVRLINAGHHYDGVLMDLQMPVMDGFQATEVIRRRHDMASLPIIAMTAGVLFKDRQRCFDVGMNDHIGKPINMHELMHTLLKWIVPAKPAPASRAVPSEEPPETAVNWHGLEMPGLKVHKGLERLGGSHKLYVKLVKSFAKAHSETDVELAASLDAGDTETLRRLAHTLKGVAATIGADTLHALAARLEQKAPNQALLTLHEPVDQLVAEVRRVLDSIRSLLDSLKAQERASPARPEAEADSELVRALYAQVLELLQHCDTRLQDVCSANKETIRTWFQQRIGFYTFLEAVEQYRFEQAREVFLRQAVSPQA